MILLHLAVAAAYALAAWTCWPGSDGQSTPAPAADPSTRWSTGIVPIAVALHAWVAWNDVAAPDGLDLSLINALSVVSGLVAAITWASGLLRTLPVVGTIVLPVASVACTVCTRPFKS